METEESPTILCKARETERESKLTKRIARIYRLGIQEGGGPCIAGSQVLKVE
jgi:hypothetical protein